MAQDTLRNPLKNASSPYLGSAAHQPVNWHEWGNSPFHKAKTEDKPILLDIGAVWCHWCHVMDRESYENKEIARVINDLFVAIKVDRDERPDIDIRYQHAVRLISGQGGWPLTAFLTPDGEVFFGGTYFPPEAKMGREGLITLLPKVAEAYKTRRKDVKESAAKLTAAVGQAAKHSGNSGVLSDEILDQTAKSAFEQYDSLYGGFGSAPKFFSTSGLEALLLAHYRSPRSEYLAAVRHTLKSMARGGVRDQLTGKFHRYSVDRYWKVPHFEVMLYDNAELLKIYLHAYDATGDEELRAVAESMIASHDSELSNRETGGFYGSQDADITLEDDGDYYTWTVAEVDDALPADEAEVMKMHYDIHDVGEMHHDPARNVLFVALDAYEIAEATDRPIEEVQKLLERGKKRLLEARRNRQAPFVDRNLYADWNGMMCSAYLEAYRVLADADARNFALRTIDMFLDKAYAPGEGMRHSYFQGKAKGSGLLTDQVNMAYALLDAYEITGKAAYIVAAEDIMNFAHEVLYDEAEGGFMDAAANSDATGLLSVPTKPIEDSPIPSGNSVAAIVLDRLYYLTEEPRYREWAEGTLGAFAGVAPRLGSYAGAYAAAVDYHLHHPAHVVIVGDSADPKTSLLRRAAHAVYRPWTMVMLQPADGAEGVRIPSVLRAAVKGTHSDGSIAFVCAGQSCAPPTDDPDELTELMRSFGR